MKRSKLILDTNLWISFLINKDLSFLDTLIEQKNAILVFSQELIQEFIDVASREKFQNFFAFEDIERVLLLFDSYGKLVTVTSNVEICRDEKDNFLLNLAIDSKADFLVTGDQDLLELTKIGNTEIITFQKLKTLLKK